VKTLLKATAASALLLASASVAAAQTHQIQWWDFLSGGDGVRMKALIDDFNAEHPDIQITATTLEWGVPFYTKVRTSAAVGQGPDIMTYHLSRLSLALEEGVLSPITEEDLSNAGVSRDEFFEASMEAASADGTLYAVPFDIHAIVLYYNKSYLEGTDYLDDQGNLTGIESLEDFENALAAVQENGAAVPVSFGTGDDGATYRVFFTLFRQQDGTLIENGEVLPGDNAEKARTAIEIMTRWRENGWTPEQAQYEASVALFSAGDAAFHMNGVWEVPTFTDLEERDALGFEWGAIEVPTLMDQPATWADSHAFAIPQQGGGAEMSPEKRAAVMQVIGWMERNSLRWADAGHIPAYLPVATSAEYETMEPNATYASLAENAAYDPRSEIAGVASPVYDAAINIIAPATHGYLSPEDAVEQIKMELQQLLN
jgi:multiple sugar transport system substrate-binding protein